ncbi:unnamed protein product [Larinioides sclopetarius]|uniref:Epoxide hydrolase n=1 Tax=Larinioides sclopetarius TaxID=280406 RepID=A0AAV2BAD0_9ARAC
MQLNQTSMTFDDFIQYFLPSYIFRLYRGIKKIYKASTLFSNVFIIHLFMIFFRENNKSTDLYRKVWEKRNSDKEFSAKNLSEILLALMDRLQYTEFYVHGYGWGAVTASLMARYYPYRVKGMHVNMCFALPNLFDSFIKTLIVYICPIFINKAEYNIIFPLKKKIRMLFQETGFLHLQCSKPNTFGYAMTDSPTSLAIHLLEKFHFKKNSGHLELQDEELTEKFLDNLLTLVTILWTSNDFTNGARFFKQCMSDILKRTYESEIPLTVPCGVAFFPDEIFMLPKYMMENTVEDLVSYTVMPRGGHFAALEEPLLLAKDICKFVQLVDIRSTLKIK